MRKKEKVCWVCEVRLASGLNDMGLCEPCADDLAAGRPPQRAREGHEEL
jgi:hypothetical protein